MHDMFGNSVTATSQVALHHYDRAVDAQLHAWPGVLESVEDALAEAPDFALPHALKALVLSGRGQGLQAGEVIAQAQAYSRRALPREQSHVELVTAIVEGRPRDALSKVIDHARMHPTDVLSASTALGAYGLFAFSGRADHDAARLEFTEAMAPHFPPDFPWLMVGRGWARIEAGRVDDGLAMAQRAIALRPNNGHNAHVVLHGLFESSDPEAAVNFLDEWLPGYPDDALMWGHLNWHGALAEIELGRLDAAVARLIGPIAEYLPRGTPFMGLADIGSLLWRLGLIGVEGLPWGIAHEHAKRNFPQGSNVFGELHLTMLAAARGDRHGLVAAVQHLESISESGHAGAPVALRWAQALIALLDRDSALAQEHLDACCEDSVRLGGSHAQRSVIEQTRNALRLPVTR
jgi:hypothetical protein